LNLAFALILDQHLISFTDPAYPALYTHLSSLFNKSLKQLSHLGSSTSTDAGVTTHLDLAAANYHYGRFLTRHRMSRAEVEAAKAALWEAIGYFRGNVKPMDSIRGMTAVMEVLMIEMEYKEVDKREVGETLKKLRDDIL